MISSLGGLINDIIGIVVGTIISVGIGTEVVVFIAFATQFLMALWAAIHQKIQLSELTNWLVCRFPDEELRGNLIDYRNEQFEQAQPKWRAEFKTNIFLLQATQGMVLHELQKLLTVNKRA